MNEFIFLTAKEAENAPEYTDVAWDYEEDRPVFQNGEPVLVSGIEAVKSWAYRALRTRRYSQIQNSWLYGSDLHELCGVRWQKETKIAEGRRYVEECLTQNPFIKGVTDFNARFEDDTVTVSFTLITEYGTITIGGDNLV